MKKYQWGIVGLGAIARELAESFNQETSELTAVASRISEKTESFTHRYNVPKAYESCQEMLDGAKIDIVCIVTPNRQHTDHILAALETGKHILCEKTITMNRRELADAIRLAEGKNLVLAEAMTIFNTPLYQQSRSIIDTRKLGALKMIQAPFSSYKEPDPKNRFFNPESAGGALLGIDVYAVSFTRFFLGSQPEAVASTMVPFETDVDEQSVTILCNKENELAAVSLTFQAKMPEVGVVAFENGYVTIADYPRAGRAEILFTDGTKEFIENGNISEAMNHEIKNMVYMVEGDLPSRSLFLTKDIIEISD